MDFHYGVDGQTYDFSVPGGDVVSLRDIVEILGVCGAAGDPAADADAVSAAEGLEPEQASRDIDRFMANIARIEFTDPDLVRVLPVDMNMTVGALRERYELENTEYSGELTEVQIEQINSKILRAPDWALVSMKPFDTEETLTIRLATNETFEIAVTDAQITRSYVTASGDRYLITVTYGEDAQIPDGAELVVSEITAESEAFASYYNSAVEAVGEGNEPDYARFFDIEIRKDGVKIEPNAPVTVDISLADAPQATENALKVVHFEANGPVEMQLEDGEDIRFETAGFSVYGVINYGGPPHDVNSFGGRTFIISRNGNYMTSDWLGPDPNGGAQKNIYRFRKSTNRDEAAVWHFEETETPGDYYIWTYKVEKGETVKRSAPARPTP